METIECVWLDIILQDMQSRNNKNKSEVKNFVGF